MIMMINGHRHTQTKADKKHNFITGKSPVIKSVCVDVSPWQKNNNKPTAKKT